ncbi:hypothetical protein P3L10_002684 [Capsicum annuum]
MSVQEYYMEFIKLAKYAKHMIPNEKAKIRRFIIGLGDHIQDTTTATTVRVEYFTSVVGFIKILEEKKRKKRDESDQNKKTWITSGFSGPISGRNKEFLRREFSAPA